MAKEVSPVRNNVVINLKSNPSKQDSGFTYDKGDQHRIEPYSKTK